MGRRHERPSIRPSSHRAHGYLRRLIDLGDAMNPDKQDAKERARLQAKIDDCRDRPADTAKYIIELEDLCDWWRTRSNDLERQLAKIKATLKELSKGTP